MRKFGPYYFGIGIDSPILRITDQVFSTDYTTVISFGNSSFWESKITKFLAGFHTNIFVLKVISECLCARR